jgi:hypothetical protein
VRKFAHKYETPKHCFVRSKLISAEVYHRQRTRNLTLPRVLSPQGVRCATIERRAFVVLRSQ